MNHTGVRSVGSRRQALTSSGSTSTYTNRPVERLGEHPVPAGPLAVRWQSLEIRPPEAGTLARARALVENAGSAPWRGLGLSYHWLDERGNPIVWDGLRTPVEAAPGERCEVEAPVRAPIPPGTYRLAFDLVDEHRFWLAELGNHAPELELEVRPRNAAGARAFLGEAAPDEEWRERAAAAHREGYAAVGGSVEWERRFLSRRPRELEQYEPGGGRNPAFPHPLVCPSLLPPLEPNSQVAGLPAWRPEGDEPWLYDARLRVTLRPRSGRPRS
jgi:hypothetical protein